MKDHSEEPFWGMTGAILKKLDAQEQSRKETSGRLTEVPASPDKTVPVSREAKLLKEVSSLHKLAVLYHSQRNYAQAERLYREELVFLGETLGPRHPEVAGVLNNLGRLYFEQKRYMEAEPLYLRSLAIVEESFGKEHLKVARRLANLAELYLAGGKHAAADLLYERALAVEEKEFGPEHPNTKKSLRAYAALLRKINEIAKAERIEARLQIPPKVREKRSGRPRRVAASARRIGARRGASRTARNRRQRARRRRKDRRAAEM